MIRILIAALGVMALAACQSQRGQRVEDVPTVAAIDALATALPLTQNAPPPPFNAPLTQFALIDNGLNELPGWRYVVQLEFNGVFAGEQNGETRAAARAEVWFNQVASARRVQLSTSGELIGQSDDVAYEAVRLGPDAFLVRDGICLSGAARDASTAADLRAGELVGGVQRALPAGRRAVINAAEVYAYSFEPEDFNLPPVRLGDEGSLSIESYELWIAPAQRAVVRFYANLLVENAYIFDRDLPVTGSLILRYDAYDFGEQFNITVPFGC